MRRSFYLLVAVVVLLVVSAGYVTIFYQGSIGSLPASGEPGGEEIGTMHA
jgi:hypothetical protein